MQKSKSNRFDVPDIEKELKRSRMLSTAAALDIIGEYEESKKIINECSINKSSVDTMDEWNTLCDISEYIKHDVEFGNGVVLIRAKSKTKPKSEHYHLHKEMLKVEDGAVLLKINDIEIKLTSGSSIKIPARTYYKCEFLSNTTIVVSMPTDVIENL